MGGVSRWFFQGVLRILICFVVVNRGEVVVDSWLIVVFCVIFLAVEKHATFSGFIFEGFPFWEFAEVKTKEKREPFEYGPA